jgi:DNA-binding transcriptional LysR family regulator
MDVTNTVRPDDMLVFAAVVRAESFSQAAIVLGLTKQRVSERIARLESALQVRLLERTTRRLRLTDTGAVYFEHCRSLAAQIDEANAIARAQQTEPIGQLRVASPLLFGRRFLAPVLREYLARYPGVQVDVTLTNRAVDLIADRFDVAIQVGRLKDSNHIVRRLGDGAVHIVASPKFLSVHGTPTVATLGATRCLSLRRDDAWRVEDALVPITPALIVNDLDVLCDLAIAGAGMAQLPALLCDDAIADGRLVRVFPDARVPMRPVSVVYPSRAFLPARVTRFVELLIAEAAVLRSA